MVKGIIFDFDGLLVDTEYIWFEILRDYFKETHDHEFSIQDYNGFVGSSGNDLLVQLFTKFGLDHDIEMEAIRDEFRRRSSGMSFMPGVLELIASIKSLGYQMGIATSSPYERPTRILGSMDALDHFDFILSREDVNKSKPAPDLFLKSLEVMNLRKDEVIIFEDSLNGFKAAKAADIDVVVVSNRVTKHSDFGHDVEVLESLLDFDLERYMNVK